MITDFAGRIGSRRGAVARSERPGASLRFDWLMSSLAGWITGGLFLDGWAHSHGKVDNTFFTPWHGILYAGLFMFGAVLVLAACRNMLRGYTPRRALPAGYDLSLVGLPLFVVAGSADLIWHTLFGFEIGVEPLLSPPHLVLACAGVLMIGGPLRAALHRPRGLEAQGWPALLPMLLSLTFTWSIFTFFTEFAHPFSTTWAATDRAGDLGQSLGAAGVLLQSALTMGVTLLVLGRWDLPAGGLTLVFTLNAVLMSMLNDQVRLIPVALVAGAVADGLRIWLRPSSARPGALRLFAFVLPVVLYSAYFLALALSSGLAWTVHLWLGSIILAGVTGLLLSYLVVPPIAESA